MKIKECKRTGVTLEFFNKHEYHWKPNATIRNKFCDCVIPYLEKLFSTADKKLVKDYDYLLYGILAKNITSNLDDFIDVVIQLVENSYQKLEKEFNIEYPDVTQDYDDAMTIEEFRSFFKLALAMKLASFVIHSTKINVNVNYVVDRLVRHFIKKETMKKLSTYVVGAVNSSKFAREAMWNYLIESVGITPEQHIQVILSNFFKSMMVLYDTAKQPNVMSYLAGFTNQALYYLFTDTYDRYIQFVNIMKVRFSKEYDIVRQQAVLWLFEQITKFLKAYYPPVVDIDTDHILYKTYKIKPYDVSQKGVTVSPIFKYITVPLMSFIFRSSYEYFNESKDMRYVELYISLIVENRLKLPYLAKLIRSIVVGKSTKKSKINRIKIGKLENMNFKEKVVMKKKKFFHNICHEIRQYLYYDPILNDVYVIDFDTFLDELQQLYYLLFINQTKLKYELDDVIRWYERYDLVKQKELEALF